MIYVQISECAKQTESIKTGINKNFSKRLIELGFATRCHAIEFPNITTWAYVIPQALVMWRGEGLHIAPSKNSHRANSLSS